MKLSKREILILLASVDKVGETINSDEGLIIFDPDSPEEETATFDEIIDMKIRLQDEARKAIKKERKRRFGP